jgi:hypothetical protein
VHGAKGESYYSHSFIIQIHSFQVFKDATLFFSRDGTPNIATVIPAMDRIDEVLTTNALDKQYSISVQAALAMGKKTLNRYYSKTDFSDVYRIAMSAYRVVYIDLSPSKFTLLPVLHPRHKLQYFQNAGWSEEWVTTALQIVREKFESSYKSIIVEEPTSNMVRP